nr:PREDICTED: juvenile hormone epoxide hydrolase 1-like [Bemisia tabaci]
MFCKAITGVVLAISGYVVLTQLWYAAYPEEIAATLPEDVNWGARQPESLKDDGIRPFTITTSPAVIEHLKFRLNHTKFPHAPLKGVSFEYGFNIDYLKKVRSYWLNNYDWSARLKFLNSLPHFKTIVSGLDIHFVHAKPTASAKNLKVIPILLIHGWPGSIREFYELIPQLITPRKNVDYVFEVVAPSLPGFGYSEAAAIPGLATAQIGVIFKKLMNKLGHEKFYVSGGNWGFKIGRDMAIAYPENVLGFHSTMCMDVHLAPVPVAWTAVHVWIGSFIPGFAVAKEDEHRLYPSRDYANWLWTETGYLHLQATKPDTIGTALLDSPIGLAAYLMDKFSSLTNPANRKLPDGGLTKKFTLDALLDNVMIYWTTDSILTAVRLYSEYLSNDYIKLKFDAAPVKVPTACARFPYELVYSPDFRINRKFKNLVRISKYNDGGLYAAFEEPKIVANDIWTSIPLFLKARQNASSGSS